MITARHLAGAAHLGRIGAVAFAVVACASTQFDRALDAHQWSDAATALNADTSMLNNESTLFRAAMLYSFPNRATYDPMRARELFERLLRQYPATPMRQATADQLSLLYTLQRTSDDAAARQQELQSEIAQLAADTLQLRRSADSIAVRLRAEQDQTAVLRRIATRLENDLQEREAQLRALHDELNHLKAIDLKRPLRAQNRGPSAKKPTPR
jgi:hypothetical protein